MLMSTFYLFTMFYRRLSPIPSREKPVKKKNTGGFPTGDHCWSRKGAEWQKAVAFLSLAMEQSMQATIITYSATISACEKAGKWQEAHRAHGSKRVVRQKCPNQASFWGFSVTIKVKAGLCWAGEIYHLPFYEWRKTHPIFGGFVFRCPEKQRYAVHLAEMPRQARPILNSAEPQRIVLPISPNISR